MVAFSIPEIKTFLADRFETTDTRDPNNMTKRVDKYSSMFNALSKKGALDNIKTFNTINVVCPEKTASHLPPIKIDLFLLGDGGGKIVIE